MQDLDAFIRSQWPNGGYKAGRYLPDGSFAYVARLAFTYGLHLGGNVDSACRYRFCFKTEASALAALAGLKSVEDIPAGDWVACRPQERMPQPCFFEMGVGHMTFDEALSKGLYRKEELLPYLNMSPNDQGLKDFYQRLEKS